MDIGIDFSLIAYILFAAFVGLGFPYLLLTTGRQYAAGFVVIASLGAFIYFGMQWFNGLRLKKDIFSGSVSPDSPWPPQINYCPDYLSLVKGATTGTGASAKTNYYCVDTTGVSGLTKYTSSGTICAVQKDGTTLKDDTSADGATCTVANAMKLDPGTSTTPATGATYSAVLTSKGLTWEGVYDGLSTSNRPIPYPK